MQIQAVRGTTVRPGCVQQKDFGPDVGQYMHPQEFVGVSVHDQLHEPARLSHRPGPSHPSHQLIAHLDLPACGGGGSSCVVGTA